MSERSKGFAFVIGTCIIWGLSPLYYYAIKGTPALGILAHRTIWSLLFFVLLLGWQGRLHQLGRAVVGPHWRRILMAALLISGNWFIFIWAVLAGRAVEASLGYYIMPLISVALGVVFLRESLMPLQWAAVGLALVAVLLLTFGLGVTPWIALGVAGTFGTYGMVKKKMVLGPVMSVAAEVAMLAPLALLWLIFAGVGQGFGTDLGQTALLIGSGIITAVPLMMFTYGAQRVNLATLGITSYLNPTLQFLSATLVLMEPFTRWHLIAFAMIWLALGLYAVSLILTVRRGVVDSQVSANAQALVPGADAAIRGGYASRGRDD